MKYCSHCGAEIVDDAIVCPKCGCQVARKNNDSTSKGWGVLGFFFPLIGLILYLIWKDETPNRAHLVGKGALIGVITSVAISILSVIFEAVIVSLAVGAMY